MLHIDDFVNNIVTNALHTRHELFDMLVTCDIFTAPPGLISFIIRYPSS